MWLLGIVHVRMLILRVFASLCQHTCKYSQILCQKFSNYTHIMLLKVQCCLLDFNVAPGLLAFAPRPFPECRDSMPDDTQTESMQAETECSGSEKRQVPSGLSMQPCLSALWNVPLKIVCISGLNSMFWSVSNMS